MQNRSIYSFALLFKKISCTCASKQLTRDGHKSTAGSSLFIGWTSVRCFPDLIPVGSASEWTPADRDGALKGWTPVRPINEQAWSVTLAAHAHFYCLPSLWHIFWMKCAMLILRYSIRPPALNTSFWNMWNLCHIPLQNNFKTFAVLEQKELHRTSGVN